MYRKTHYFLLFIGLCIVLTGYGQAGPDTLISEVTPADFHPSSPVIDSNVNVVILRDSGRADLESYFGDWRVKQTRYRRLLIRNRNGFEAAKAEISFDPEVNLLGSRVTLQGYTCNLADGRVVL